MWRRVLGGTASVGLLAIVRPDFALVLGGGTAVAATGGNFILRHSNTAGATTTLTNAKGTALSVKSKPGTPVLRVSNQVKVPALNSDKLNGKDNTAFAVTAGRTAFFNSAAQGFDSDVNGVDEFFVAVATRPSGTQGTGGGALDNTSTGLTFANTPDIGTANSWAVAVLTDNVTVEDANSVTASIVCYNPRGRVTGGAALTAPHGNVMDRLSDEPAQKIMARASR